jgi:hypothetical protein
MLLSTGAFDWPTGLLAWFLAQWFFADLFLAASAHFFSGLAVRALQSVASSIFCLPWHGDSDYL